MAVMETSIVRFYRGTGLDARGRSLDEVLAWDDKRLEDVHDYIQWLFPLDEPSQFNPHAPMLTAADRAAFERDPDLAANLGRAFERMLAFFGLALDQSRQSPRVVRSTQWRDRSAAWLHPGNHNVLRLTRIMKSLCLLGQARLANALYEVLADQTRGRVTETTLAYWQDAVQHKGRR
jgi:hypothetical protein